MGLPSPDFIEDFFKKGVFLHDFCRYHGAKRVCLANGEKMLTASDWKQCPVSLAIATVGGLGLAPIAPGTVGSFLPILLLWWGRADLEWLWRGLFCVVAAGLWAIDRVQRCGVDAGEVKPHDPAWVVVDEVAGQLLTCCVLGCFYPLNRWFLFYALLAFRVCDILKPWPIGWIDRSLSEQPRWRVVSVMLDDLAAGVLAALILLGALRWAPL